MCVQQVPVNVMCGFICGYSTNVGCFVVVVEYACSWFVKDNDETGL